MAGEQASWVKVVKEFKHFHEKSIDGSVLSLKPTNLLSEWGVGSVLRKPEKSTSYKDDVFVKWRTASRPMQYLILLNTREWISVLAVLKGSRGLILQMLSSWSGGIVAVLKIDTFILIDVFNRTPRFLVPGAIDNDYWREEHSVSGKEISIRCREIQNSPFGAVHHQRPECHPVANFNVAVWDEWMNVSIKSW